MIGFGFFFMLVEMLVLENGFVVVFFLVDGGKMYVIFGGEGVFVLDLYLF